jgi:hypothetical protein
MAAKLKAAILFVPLEILAEVFVTTSLDRFVMNKISFMSGTGIKLNPKTDHCLVFGC